MATGIIPSDEGVMVMMRKAAIRAMAIGMVSMLSLAAQAADYPAPQPGDWIAHDLRFHTGQVLAAAKLHYTTVGSPAGEPVLILHGTAGTGSGMLNPAFAGELFGPGQPLDAAKYFIILPDTIGTGGSAKPSDGLRAKFPQYDYDDLVQAQYRLLTQGLGLHHLRLVLGNSMGGMETWVWGMKYPGFMDALVPMASQPTAMAARNWMLRRMLIESIRQDPAYQGGDYATQPPSLRLANVLFGLATNGGTLAWQARAATHAAADGIVDAQLAAPAPSDANDFIWQWNASSDYDPEPMLSRIEAPVLAINSADDERNPPETGVTALALTKVKNARLYLIPASAETHGHGTTGYAAFWANRLQSFLPTVPTHHPM
jgi:homoserine O-acetyltransferase